MSPFTKFGFISDKTIKILVAEFVCVCYHPDIVAETSTPNSSIDWDILHLKNFQEHRLRLRTKDRIQTRFQKTSFSSLPLAQDASLLCSRPSSPQTAAILELGVCRGQDVVRTSVTQASYASILFLPHFDVMYSLLEQTHGSRESFRLSFFSNSINGNILFIG